MTYAPKDFKSPRGTLFPYLGTFGRWEWESVAAQIVEESQKAGKWTPVKNFHPSVYTRNMNTGEMVASGWFEETDEGFMLTDAGLERLAERYLK